MRSKLTPKQRKFWKHYCLTNSLSAAAAYAGSDGKDVKSLATIGRQMLNSLELSMPELLDAKGLTDENMVEPLRDGLEASKPIVATWEGKVTDQFWFPDHATRHKFLETYHKLRGNLVDRHEVTGKDGGDLIIQVGPKTRSRQDEAIEIE